MSKKIMLHILFILFMAGLSFSAGNEQNLVYFLQSAGIDFDGDGISTKTEDMLVELMVSELGADNPVVLKIVQAVGIALGNGATTAVDVSGILDPYAVSEGSTSGGKDGSCDCKAFIRGDANNDNGVNIADAVAVFVLFVFWGGCT